jgi:hypothetical protein
MEGEEKSEIKKFESHGVSNLESQSQMLNDDEAEELKVRTRSRSQSRGNANGQDEILMEGETPKKEGEEATQRKEGHMRSREDSRRDSKSRKEAKTEQELQQE